MKFLVALLPLFFGTCYCRRENITNLVELGSKINSTLLGTVNVTGQEFLKDVTEFCKELKEMQVDMTQEFPYVFIMYDRVKVRGGPPQLQRGVRSTIRKRPWSGDEIKRILEVVDDTKRRWKSLTNFTVKKRREWGIIT